MKFLSPVVLFLLAASCAPSSPVQRASESKSHFNPPPQVMSHNYPDRDVYRVYQRGGSGFVPVNAVRNAAEERAENFARRQGRGMVVLGEETGGEVPLPGSFPRCEIIFALTGKKP
jgi:hypothetical protein